MWTDKIINDSSYWIATYVATHLKEMLLVMAVILPAFLQVYNPLSLGGYTQLLFAAENIISR